MDKATAIKQRAQAHIQRNAMPEAMAEYEKLLGIEPIDPYAYILLGDLAVRMKNRDVALKRYGQAVDAYEGQGLCRNAIAVLKKIQRIDAGQIESLRRLADLYARENLMAESMAHYLEFASKCLEAQREEDTRQVLEIVVQLGTPNAKVALSVAELFVAVGDRERAALELERMAGELETRGQVERAKALRARAAELAPRVEVAETVIAFAPLQETGERPGLAETTSDAADMESAAAGADGHANDSHAVIDEGTTIADYSQSEPPAQVEPALDMAPPPSVAESVMPGLERMGDLFGPASPPSAVPLPSFLGFEHAEPSVAPVSETGGVSAGGGASDAIEPGEAIHVIDADGTFEASATADAGEDLVVLSAGEESAAAIEAFAGEADDMAARIRGWASEVAAHLEAGDREGAEAVLAAAASESELAGENTAARRFLVELWELGKREARVAEKLKDLSAASGDQAAEARWTAETGEILLADGDWERARAAFERALELDPEEPLARRRSERLKHLGTTEAVMETAAVAPAESAEPAALEEPTEPAADIDLVIETSAGALAVPLAEPEPVAEAEPEPVAEAEPEPVAEAEPIAEVEPIADDEPMTEAELLAGDLPLAEMEALAQTEPIAEVEPGAEVESSAEVEPIIEAEPIAEALAAEIPDPEVLQLDHEELHGGAALDGVSGLDFLGGNGDRTPSPAPAPPGAGTPSVPADPSTDDQLAWVIGRFRRDVSSQLGSTDHASHYDLGMAYMEMGLHQEAIAEFRQAVGGATYRRRCLELLATCYSRSGEPNLAASHWRAALDEATRTGEGVLPIRYALALSLAAAGQLVGARDELREVVRSDPSFLDARERLQALDA